MGWGGGVPLDLHFLHICKGEADDSAPRAGP